MNRINQASAAVRSNFSETTEYARKLYDGSIEQSAALKRLTGKMDLIPDKTDEIDKNVQRVKESADKARTCVDEGQRQMGDMFGTKDRRDHRKGEHVHRSGNEDGTGNCRVISQRQ